MKIDLIWFEISSDLLVNLAVLTMDILLGTLCLVGAFKFKKLIRGKNYD